VSLLYLLDTNIASCYLRRSSPLLETRVNEGLLQQTVALSVLTRAELEERAGGLFPLALPLGPGRGNVPTRRSYQVGDRVRVRNDHVAGHVRMPGYIRGKTGVVVSESPRYPFPDAHAHGIAAEDEPTYDVRFKSTDLWPDVADDALVHVGVFQSYLEPAA